MVEQGTHKPEVAGSNPAAAIFGEPWPDDVVLTFREFKPLGLHRRWDAIWDGMDGDVYPSRLHADDTDAERLYDLRPLRGTSPGALGSMFGR